MPKIIENRCTIPVCVNTAYGLCCDYCKKDGCKKRCKNISEKCGMYEHYDKQASFDRFAEELIARSTKQKLLHDYDDGYKYHESWGWA